MAEFPPVLILCGGLGTRIRSINANLPKALTPVKGEPFIAHQLRLLAREGVREAFLCVGYLCQPLIEYVGSGEAFGIKVTYSYEDEKNLLGTGGAVLKASANVNGPFAVIYGDSYLDTKYAPIYGVFQQADKLGLMTVFKNNNKWVKSNILYSSGMIVDYNKKEPRAAMQHVDYGLSFFQPQAFAGFSQGRNFDLAEVFSALIKKEQLAAYEVKERFYEAGSPQGIEELESYLQGRN